ncbi:hypothetical protein L6452_18532 [Arctium lappa]|uniref:Uncharacterized protein n=1 Tax=Arctium lappa TaxID=4217 RepID=A0ACB9C6H8_ARCLA|nr:hypothetical protein L6452_18532 [Arctium lappa]
MRWIFVSGGGPGVDIMNEFLNLGISKVPDEDEGSMQATCFSDVFNDISLNFQIIRLPKHQFITFCCILSSEIHSRSSTFKFSLY